MLCDACPSVSTHNSPNIHGPAAHPLPSYYRAPELIPCSIAPLKLTAPIMAAVQIAQKPRPNQLGFLDLPAGNIQRINDRSSPLNHLW